MFNSSAITHRAISPGAEVWSAFAAHMPEHARLNFTSVHSFDTIGTGFAVGQLGMAESKLRPSNLLIFANCAPRKDIKDARVNNEGEGLLFVTLKNGVQIIARKQRIFTVVCEKRYSGS